MSEEAIVIIAQLLIKYGPDVGTAFAKMFKGGATVDDAIAALELAKTKTAEQYLTEAKVAAGQIVPIGPPA
jgi:4-hydroxy-L-threonine phosphate dehydrogenase PdxA